MKSVRMSPCVKFYNWSIGFDYFGQPFFFRLPDGRKEKRTWQGLILTILVSVEILFYSSVQIAKLVSFGENTVMVSPRDNYFDSNFEFTTNDGLMLAFALTEFDENSDVIEDPDYGELKAYYNTWGLKDSPDAGEVFTEIPTSFCTKKQLGLAEDQENRLFYPKHKNAVNDLEKYNKKFRCFDSEFLRI